MITHRTAAVHPCHRRDLCGCCCCSRRIRTSCGGVETIRWWSCAKWWWWWLLLLLLLLELGSGTRQSSGSSNGVWAFDSSPTMTPGGWRTRRRPCHFPLQPPQQSSSWQPLQPFLTSSLLLVHNQNNNDNNNDKDNDDITNNNNNSQRNARLLMASAPTTTTTNTTTPSSLMILSSLLVLMVATLGVVVSAADAADAAITVTSTTSTTAAAVVVAATTTTSVQQESFSGFIAGFLLTFAKTVVRYPLDTATVRLQVAVPNIATRTGNSSNDSNSSNDNHSDHSNSSSNDSNHNEPYYSIWQPARLLENCYRGFALSFLSTIPAGAFYFAVKDAVTHVLSQPVAITTTTILGGGGGQAWPLSGSLPPLLVTMIAVALAQVPYWIIRNPSEVVKTRQQAELDGFDATVPVLQAYQRLYANEGWQGFYTGYWENVIYSYPSDVIKFTCYGYWVTAFAHAMNHDGGGGGGTTSMAPTPLQGAIVGALVTVLAQYSTTPLDVVRNRLMTTTTTTFGTTNEPHQHHHGARPRPEEKRHPHHHSLVSMNAATGTMESSTSSSSPPSIALYAQALVQLAQQEGLKGLFAGGWPTILKSLIIGAIQFATYEQTKLMMLASTTSATPSHL